MLSTLTPRRGCGCLTLVQESMKQPISGDILKEIGTRDGISAKAEPRSRYSRLESSALEGVPRLGTSSREGILRLGTSARHTFPLGFLPRNPFIRSR